MEKLYNNVLLADDFMSKPNDRHHVPYLENPPEVINVSCGRQLFVDDFLVEETGLSPIYHRVEKYSQNPVLWPETPIEIMQLPVACPKSGGVWYDEEEHRFKMWYEAGWLRNLCYAESTDGIRWERPDLGIVKGTNLILPYDGFESEKYTGGPSYLRPDSTTVFLDPDGPKSERYKLFLRNPGEREPAIVAVSSDGIRFDKFRQTTPVDDRSTVFYNPFRKKWVYSIRYAELENGGVVRKRHYREADDFLAGAVWNENEAPEWMRCDESDEPNPYIGAAPQLYNVDCVGYESIMLGMFQILYGPDNESCGVYGAPKITELIPMYSRDGYHFSRPNSSIIGASMYSGAWDRGYIQSVGGVCMIDGDKLRIYYIGFAGDETHRGEPWTTNGMYANGATGFAELRRDGFVSMDGSGVLLTRKLTFEDKEALFVNAKGTVSAQILSESGELIAASSPFSGDSTKAQLLFDKYEIRTLNAKTFRLKFTVDGSLYSFGFADKNGDFGGAHAAGMIR